MMVSEMVPHGAVCHRMHGRGGPMWAGNTPFPSPAPHPVQMKLIRMLAVGWSAVLDIGSPRVRRTRPIRTPWRCFSCCVTLGILRGQLVAHANPSGFQHTLRCATKSFWAKIAGLRV